MEFDLDDEQRTLRDEARRFLEREAPVAYARAMLEDERGWRDETWRAMADIGWMALPFPEDAGGLGQGFIALSILLAEMGRVVLPGPYAPSVLAAGSAVEAGASPQQRKDLLSGIASGEVVAALVLGDRRGEGGVRTDGSRLYGEARFVTGGADATRFVVAAHTPDGPRIVVSDDAARVERTPLRTMDPTRRAADVRFDGAEAEPLAAGDAVALQRALDRCGAGIAAEMLGLAERALEISVEYAKARVQFDRPIGSFQAVKHRAADMLLDVESVRNAVYYAAWAVERGHDDASLAASMAKAYASDACRRVTAGAIQIHGGVGFTWEHDAHLYFKRAKANEVWFGDATHHRERMARILHDRYAPA